MDILKSTYGKIISLSAKFSRNSLNSHIKNLGKCVQGKSNIKN